MKRLLALALGGAGCNGDEACDTSARASLTVSVGSAGTDLPDALVTYRRDGGSVSMCEPLGGGEWVCGWEVDGDLEVRVSHFGYAPVEDTVTVAPGECHVDGQTLHVDLVPWTEGCTEEVAPSAIATVEDDSGGTDGVPGAGVTFTGVSHGSGVPEACTEGVPGSFVCGQEVPGLMTIQATADGHESAAAEIIVLADACHVLTETVDLFLPFLED